ncbi:MAG: hydroxymethylbilane synthase [Planctomycetota bacterium]|nr:hydroxymethylbilane synthase [Planctomycetota bacterium]
MLAAVSQREDVRDVAVLRGGKRLRELPDGAVIGSGSPRRRAQLALKYPRLRFAEIRGNVETRLRKVAEGAYAGTILARAGLKRLGRPERDAEVLPLAVMLPAPGQGALGLECRAADRRTRRLLAALHDPKAAACVEAERACLAALGGGCHLPLGACGRIGRDGRLTLQAVLALPDGSLAARAKVTGQPVEARRLGRQAARRIRHSNEGKKVLSRLASARVSD